MKSARKNNLSGLNRPTICKIPVKESKKIVRELLSEYGSSLSKDSRYIAKNIIAPPTKIYEINPSIKSPTKIPAVIKYSNPNIFDKVKRNMDQINGFKILALLNT